jgi:signal transduction histidine kinase/CheY-like chemotaxis protein
MLHPDGTLHWVEGKGQVLYDAEGKPDRMLGVCSEITQRKQTEEAVRQSQKLESLGVLAGGIAHDFNNLLTGVIGGTSLALEGLDPQDLTSQLLKNVLEAGERAASLTRQLLAYAGKGQFVIEPIDVSDLILQSRELLSQAVPKKVQLRLQPARNLPLVYADRSQLHQLLLNLVINGAEAIGDDRIGTVQVNTAVVEVRRPEGGRSTEVPSDLGAGEHVVITVSDSGCGMDHATLARAFDPFFSTKFTGRGLGLSAVQGIVRGMKGAIQVQSTPGRGSVFTVFLPAASPRSRFVVERPNTAQKRTGAAVLVIDDESVVRETARCALERAGYSVTVAEDGAEAVRLFRACAADFDVVLLDLTMPLMSGQETLESLRAIRADVPVILSSGYSEDEASRRVGGGKLAGFLQKPYTAARLCRMLQAVLGAAGTSAAQSSLE